MPKLKVDNIKTFNWMNAIRGMRNPLKSWGKMDSSYEIDEKEGTKFIMGDNDYDLALKLATAGSDHGKFLRQIFISMDIIASWMFWKQYATYKVATVENSTSMMHTLGDKDLTPDNFCWDKVTPFRKKFLEHINSLAREYRELERKIKDIKSKNRKAKKKKKELREKKKSVWRELNEDMSGSYLYKRTVSLNYEVARNMYFARKGHRLIEWKLLRNVFEKLPYSDLITEPR